MRILRCDLCGHEVHDADGITASAYRNHDFQTLEYRWRADGVVDVCGPCYKKLQKTIGDARQREEEAAKLLAKDKVVAAIREARGMTNLSRQPQPGEIVAIPGAPRRSFRGVLRKLLGGR